VTRSYSFLLQGCTKTAGPSTLDEGESSISSHYPSSIPSLNQNDVVDSLPNGWKPSNKATGGRTALILTLSLVLAFFICGLMVGCIRLRKKKGRLRKEQD
jgi:hypothetical protein